MDIYWWIGLAYIAIALVMGGVFSSSTDDPTDGLGAGLIWPAILLILLGYMIGDWLAE